MFPFFVLLPVPAVICLAIHGFLYTGWPLLNKQNITKVEKIVKIMAELKAK